MTQLSLSILLALSLAAGCTARMGRTRSSEEEWHFPPGHPVHGLFPRAAGTTSNGTEVFPTVGSSEWQALFPSSWGTFTNTSAKPEWLAALNAAKTQGLIPKNVPISTLNQTSGYTIYNAADPKGDVVCSATWFCRGPDDVWDAPEGHVGLAFDDGPLPNSSPTLYAFLKEQNETATHFFIGSNILANPTIFLQAFEQGDDIACHTYNHPYMTTLTDEEVVAEFGWQLEIVRVSTGGRIPRYWRPPYGDVDNRVRGIATHVFGLTTVIWNHDSLDWELPEGPVTPAGLRQNYTKWYTGPASPGLIILSHELTMDSVTAWMDMYPLIHQNGWQTRSISDLFGTEGGWYVNAQNDTTPVVTGVLDAQAPGTPVWSGYSSLPASQTHLTFTSTIVDGSTIALSGATPTTATTTPRANAATPHLSGDLRAWEVLLGLYISSNIL